MTGRHVIFYKNQDWGLMFFKFRWISSFYALLSNFNQYKMDLDADVPFSCLIWNSRIEISNLLEIK